MKRAAGVALAVIVALAVLTPAQAASATDASQLSEKVRAMGALDVFFDMDAKTAGVRVPPGVRIEPWDVRKFEKQYGYDIELLPTEVTPALVDKLSSIMRSLIDRGKISSGFAGYSPTTDDLTLTSDLEEDDYYLVRDVIGDRVVFEYGQFYAGGGPPEHDPLWLAITRVQISVVGLAIAEF